MSNIEALNQLRAEFVRLAEAEQNAASQLRSRRAHRLGPRILVFAGALGCAVLLGAILVTISDREGSSVGASATVDTGTTGSNSSGNGDIWKANRPVPTTGHDPFASGGRIPVAKAIAEAGYPFPIANAPSANSRILSNVWISRASTIVSGAAPGRAREIAFEYTSGIRVFIRPAPPTFLGNGQSQFEWMAGHHQLGSASLHSINGSILLIGLRRGAGGLPTAEMIYRGTKPPLEILIIGSVHTSASDVVAIASSLARD